jgi:hypothetical protein
MSDIAEELRATSDGLVRDLDVLSALEDEKRGLEPGDSRLVQLAERIQELAARVLSGSSRQRHLTEAVVAEVQADSPTAPDTSIEDAPRSIVLILAEWRAAERRVEAAETGSAEAIEAQALSDHLREEYRQAWEARQS